MNVHEATLTRTPDAGKSAIEAKLGSEVEFLPYDRLAALGPSLSDTYRSADPFPHIVIDDFLSDDAYAVLSKAYPGQDEDIWYKFRSGRENLKLQSRDLRDLPWPIKLFISEVNGPDFVRFLEALTGIANLVPDPHLFGGGLHQTLSGGHLGMHVDYNYHTEWQLDRRLNAILYMNDTWEDSWGGHLELWDKDVSRCVQRIAPLRNRLVVFSTSEKSWHGHPTPMKLPEGVTRKSIALYYYSNGRPESERAPAHSTTFKARPGEHFALTPKERLREFVPPILLRMARRLRGED